MVTGIWRQVYVFISSYGIVKKEVSGWFPVGTGRRVFGNYLLYHK